MLVTKPLQIGEIAKHTGLTIKTIRYYEEYGLLKPTVQRARSGYRLFNIRVLNRLAFIKRAQFFGLRLDEIDKILEIHDQSQLPCGHVKHLLEAKLEEVNTKKEALDTLQAELQGVLSGWKDQPPANLIAHTICPNILPAQLGK